MSSLSSLFPHLSVSEERSRREPDESLLENQPFLPQGLMNPITYFSAQMSREAGVWTEAMSQEQTAYALAQVSAASVLPPLLDLADGNALLDYHVKLRDHLDSALVAELAAVLATRGQEFHWNRVDVTVFSSVIGWGVAACIDTTDKAETLYLRYANSLAAEFFIAGRAADMPRSRLAMQEALYERVDILLEQTRIRTWYWLAG